MAELVKCIEEILKNVRTLAQYRNGAPEDAQYYERIIANGKNFVVAQQGGETFFSPSRFVGYVNNNRWKHDNNSGKYGGETDNRIKKLLGPYFTRGDYQFDRLHALYLEHCENENIKPSKDVVIRRKYIELPAGLVTKIQEGIDIAEIEKRTNLNETQKEEFRQARRGHGGFRRRVLEFWRGCAVTNCQTETALRASHILPWSKATDEQRLDPNNGLLLIANLDALFDRGLISFADSGKMLVSSSLSHEDRRILGVGGKLRLRLNAAQKKYLSWHRAQRTF